MVAAVDSAEDFGFRTKCGVDTLNEQWFDERCSTSDWTAWLYCERACDHWLGAVGARNHTWTDIRVAKAGKLAAETPEVAHGTHSTPAKIMLQRHINLMNLRILEIGIEEGNILPHSAEIRQDSRKDRGCGSRTEAQRNLRPLSSSIDQCIEDGGIDDAAVVQAISATENRLSIAGHVPGKADTRSEIICVAGKFFGLRQRGIRQHRIWELLIFIPESQREAQTRQNLPVVLRKKRVFIRVEFQPGKTQTLREAIGGVALLPSATFQDIQVSEIVHQAVVGVSSKPIEQILRIIIHVAVVNTELETVIAVHPGHCIGDLTPELIREIRPLQKIRRSYGEVLGVYDDHPRCEAKRIFERRRVQQRVYFVRRGLLAELVFE